MACRLREFGWAEVDGVASAPALRFRDLFVDQNAEGGAVLTKGSTGMGANYSWPRGVAWLMSRFVAAGPPAAGQ